MLAACSPSARSYFETMNTLQYAVRAKLIQCNPKANLDGEAEAVRALHASTGALCHPSCSLQSPAYPLRPRRIGSLDRSDPPHSRTAGALRAH